MEIRIDTKKDSPDDIRKAIKLLKALINEEQDYSVSNDFSVNTGAAEGLAGMFNDDTSSDSYENTKSGDDKDDKGGKVQIIPY